MNKHIQKVADEKAQSLVVVLLLIVIAATVAMGISYRTLQDIRRTGEERMSAQATSCVESLLDAFSDDDVWAEVWGVGGQCEHIGLGAQCDFNTTYIEDQLDIALDEEDCKDPLVSIRRPVDVVGFGVEQDDVIEVPLDGAVVAGTFDIGWTGSDYLLVKVYTATGIDVDAMDPSVEHVWVLMNSGSTTDWDNVTDVTGIFEVNYSADAVLARIRPIGGNANIDITGAPDSLVGHVKASAFVNDVYGEQVREFWLYDSVPACFDYVLFDGTGTVSK